MASRTPATQHSGKRFQTPRSLSLPLRFPPAITLAMTVTSCSRCPAGTTVLACVINGMEHRLDPLALSLEGLAQAAAAGRWVAVVSPFSLLAHRAKPGHWWLAPPGGGLPTLLAEHDHATPLAHDPQLAQRLLARFLPDPVQVDPDAPPPF